MNKRIKIIATGVVSENPILRPLEKNRFYSWFPLYVTERSDMKTNYSVFAWNSTALFIDLEVKAGGKIRVKGYINPKKHIQFVLSTLMYCQHN